MYANHESFDARPLATSRRGGLIETLRAAVAAPLHAWSRRRDDARAYDTLASLDAHLLRDIGAEHANLERLVRDGRD